MSLPLAGKIALVTGGSRGIGKAIVLRLARDGADVAFSFVQAEDKANAVVEAVEAMGRRAIALRAEQANRDEVVAMVKRAHAHFGRLDILIANAAIIVHSMVDDAAADFDAIDRLYDINLRGTVAAVRAAAPLLSDGGRIISIGSTSASRIPFAGISDYVATKAALGGLTRVWARDLGPRAINVNLVQSGSVVTDMHKNSADGPNGVRSLTCLQRHGHPDELAGAVAFLAGPDASYITASTLNVDGGLAGG